MKILLIIIGLLTGLAVAVALIELYQHYLAKPRPIP